MATELRKRIADILHSEHRVSQTKLRGLSSKDTAELHAIASGARVPEHRVKAMSLLAATGDPLAGDVFRSALADRSAGVEVRAAGATWLSRLGGMAAEGALLDGLAAADEVPIVQHKIIAGLARVGSGASLRRLADAVQAMDPAVREHAAFARSVVAYRSGTPGFELPVVEPAMLLPAPPGAAAVASASAAQPEVALRLLEQIAGDSYGVVGEHDTVTLFQHGRRQKAAVLGRAGLQDARSRPAIAGLVALRAETDGSYATSLLALTWPNGAYGVHLSMNRLSGRAMYFGEGSFDGDALRFRLDAVRGPGTTETTVSGSVVDGRIVDLQFSLGRTLERLRPTPMEDR